MKYTPTLLEQLKRYKDVHEKLKKDNFPFNERELAKAELVNSLLKKVEAGNLKVGFPADKVEEAYRDGVLNAEAGTDDFDINDYQ